MNSTFLNKWNPLIRIYKIIILFVAYESKFNKNKYLDILKERVLLNCKALYSMRYILKRNIEKGLLPNYQNGAVELDKQFCTIGGIGIFEVMDLFVSKRQQLLKIPTLSLTKKLESDHLILCSEHQRAKFSSTK